MTQTPPDADTLRKFALGDLPPTEWDRVARYLEANPPSPDTLAEPAAEDTFVSALRAAPAAAPADPPELRSIIDAAAKLVPDTATAAFADARSIPFEPTAEYVAPPKPGEKLGRFLVARVLGKGGMGVVYAAADEQLDRQIALKVMAPQLAANPVAKERFLREARTAARVEHDNIVPILEVGEDRGIPFMAMPLLRGRSLDERLGEGTPGLDEALAIARGTLDGLAAAHDRGLIHRDIKPSNLWLEANDDGSFRRVRLLDFGLARLETDADRVTASGTILGTPAFMAPEQARGEAVDARADLFSLGCVLYRLVTGQNAFKGNDTYSLLTSLAMDRPKAPIEWNADLPRPLSDLIVNLLEKDAKDRPPSARAVRERLTALAEPAPARRRSRALPIAAIALSLIGLVGILFGGTIVRIATNKGELVVEVNDDNVEIVVKQNGAVVVDKTKDRRFVLTATDGEIEFLDPETGATAQTKTFRLSRGGVDRVTARMGEGKPPVAKHGGLEPKSAEPSRRSVVERVLAAGGTAVVQAGNRRLQVAEVKQIPNGEFEPVIVDLFARRTVTPELVADLATLPKLEQLKLARSTSTNVGYDRFDRLANLQLLDVAQTRFDDAALQPIGKLADLRILHLSDSAVTATGLRSLEGLTKLQNLGMVNVRSGDEGMESIAKLRSLRDLNLEGTGITDVGLEQLTVLNNLVDLAVRNNSKLSPQAVQKFAAALPACRIHWSGGVIEPKGASDADRKAAEFAIKVGGKVRVNGETIDIASAKDLPTKAFQLTGVDLSYLANLKDGDFAVFADCRHLRELDLRATKPSPAWFAHFRNCSNLEVLNLDYTGIGDAGLENFKNCKKLKVLKLATTKVTATGLAHFAECADLTDLALEGAAIDDAAIARFQDCRKLRNLFLSHAAITDAGLAKFAACFDLESLNLNHVQGVGDDGFRALPSAKMMVAYLGGTRITDASLDKFEGNRVLQTLHLAGTKVTNAGLAKLKKCPALEVLNLGGLPITDDGFAPLAGLNFSALQLSHTKIRDAGLAHLKASTRLRNLELANTAVSDRGVSSLRDFKEMKALELSGCPAITGATLKDLNLAQLESLNMARTAFNDDGLAALAKLPNLRMVHCEGSKVTRGGIEKLHEARPKSTIVWDGGTVAPK